MLVWFRDGCNEHSSEPCVTYEVILAVYTFVRCIPCMLPSCLSWVLPSAVRLATLFKHSALSLNFPTSHKKQKGDTGTLNRLIHKCTKYWHDNIINNALLTFTAADSKVMKGMPYWQVLYICYYLLFFFYPCIPECLFLSVFLLLLHHKRPRCGTNKGSLNMNLNLRGLCRCVQHKTI